MVLADAVAIVHATPLPPAESLNIDQEIRYTLRQLARLRDVLEEKSSQLTSLVVVDGLGKTDLHPAVVVYQKTLTDVVDLLIKAKRAGLADDEEEVEREKWRRLMGAVLKGIQSDRANLDFDQQQDLRSAISEEVEKVVAAEEAA